MSKPGEYLRSWSTGGGEICRNQKLKLELHNLIEINCRNVSYLNWVCLVRWVIFSLVSSHYKYWPGCHIGQAEGEQFLAFLSQYDGQLSRVILSHVDITLVVGASHVTTLELGKADDLRMRSLIGVEFYMISWSAAWHTYLYSILILICPPDISS